ncbi:MAG: MFS transporter [Anaerolineales bacterium]|nr:MFS transporter [Anaerolineales bacterium]
MNKQTTVIYFAPFAVMPKTFDRNLFFARAHYFAFMGGWGFILPFINLFYVSLGLKGAQIGTITSTSSIVGLLFAPFIVNEIKKRPQARGLLQTAMLLGALGYFMLGHQTIYLLILVNVFFQALAGSGVMPVSDAMAVSVSKEAGGGYGSIRVFASLGWIVATLTSGWLIQRFGFLVGFIGVSVMWSLGALIISFINPRFFVTQQSTQSSKPNLLTTAKRVISDRTLLGFAIALIFIGFMNSGVLQFENVFLAELGTSKQLISVAGILSAVVELPFMIYADRFVKRYGASQILLVAILMTMIQRAAVLLFPSIATIMIVRFIGGTAFSMYTVSYIGLISSRTDQSETGTMLALYTVTLASLVNILAAPVSGAIFDVIGARWLYALSASGYAIGAICIWLSRPTVVLNNESVPTLQPE